MVGQQVQRARLTRIVHLRCLLRFGRDSLGIKESKLVANRHLLTAKGLLLVLLLPERLERIKEQVRLRRLLHTSRSCLRVTLQVAIDRWRGHHSGRLGGCRWIETHLRAA